MENVLEEARVGRGGGLNSAVPAGTVFNLLLTRQFLPGYFQPRLAALSAEQTGDTRDVHSKVRELEWLTRLAASCDCPGNRGQTERSPFFDKWKSVNIPSVASFPFLYLCA